MGRKRRQVVNEPAGEESLALELEFHRAMRVRELVAGGMSEESARAQVESEPVASASIRAACAPYEARMRRRRAQEWLREGVRDGMRQLRHRPWSAGAVIAVAVLATAAVAAAVMLLWSTVVRPLPFGDAHQVMAVHTIDGRVGDAPRRGTAAPGDVLDWQSLPSFAAVGALNTMPVTMYVGEEPHRIMSILASRDVPQVLRLRPHLGRWFEAEDYTAESAPVLMLSWESWRSLFGADSSVVGRVVRFGGGSAEIIGVLPPLPRPAPLIEGDVWFPFDLAENPTRGGTWLSVIARLDRGATVAVAQAELDALMSRLAGQEPATNERRTAWVEPLAAAITATSRPVLVFIAIATALVVLIAGANVAALLLGRASERRGEIALRSALGATPSALYRLFGAESVVYGLLGLALGWPLAVLAVRSFLHIYPGGLPRAHEVTADGVAWTSAVAVAVMLIALGMFPGVLRSRERNVGSALLSGTRLAGDRSGERFRMALVIGQVALCTVLLVSGTVLMRVYHQLTATPAGFESEGLVAFNITPPSARYRGQAEYLAFYDALLERIRAEAGVTSASYTSLLPFDRDNWSEGMVRDDVPRDQAVQHFVLYQRVEPSYARTLGLRVLAGRDLSPEDDAGLPRVALVNETLARRVFGSLEVLGRRIGSGERWFEIVGVVSDKRHRDLGQEPLLELYTPRRQDSNARTMWVVVRSADPPARLLPRLRELLRQADPAIAFAHPTVMSDRIAQSVAPQRFRSLLLTTLASMALLLSILGVWSLAAFRVATQTRDIGVRLALGMNPGQARTRVLAGAVLVAGIGVAIGIAVTVLGTRLVDTAVFGVPDIGSGTFAAVAALLLGITGCAALRPAWRASSVDPVDAMRSR